jgi:predicted N-formylglutamate amidohydrolase
MPLRLINRPDPDPVRKTGPSRVESRLLLVGDHAGAAIPAVLGDLGLSETDRAQHIAVDIGSQALGEALSHRLSAPFVSQAYSRLVVDCNRDPGHPGWIAAESDGTSIPGNAEAPRSQRDRREAEIFTPYHAAIGEMLDMARDPVLVSLHSFTPVMAGNERPWHIGILHDGHRDAFALRVLARLQAIAGFVIGDNEPYRMDSTDFTVPRHAFARDIPYVEIEVRQDVLADEAGVNRIAAVLGAVLEAELGN